MILQLQSMNKKKILIIVGAAILLIVIYYLLSKGKGTQVATVAADGNTGNQNSDKNESNTTAEPGTVQWDFTPAGGKKMKSKYCTLEYTGRTGIKKFQRNVGLSTTNVFDTETCKAINLYLTDFGATPSNVGEVFLDVFDSAISGLTRRDMSDEIIVTRK